MNHLICEHCKRVGLSVVPFKVEVTPSTENRPSIFNEDLCRTCRGRVESIIKSMLSGGKRVPNIVVVNNTLVEEDE